jgi:hypothetical protein
VVPVTPPDDEDVARILAQVHAGPLLTADQKNDLVEFLKSI